mmetsp:Transcript_948/g.2896  ORF Transcript_948/g.2896 Transcript_948/m.2896 type:complete len:272 (-) Transcript_948:843-1658(-)|eukprot:CAMPEP_0206137706 /NCGR_PEP_ID=MMETSP1473-20131121/2775_1 /ASSEMBLY_ACC=CAM_ASM_001109 /TAXON_ID=1461547 /ORGANISM="Stichococcus sp, Strain RCC1054" /LENGTH=271 /DNA_ID=CAMNT_0053530907 /DNA_START=157 /DNA_END=972 /DNA_ORIENTATION=+
MQALMAPSCSMLPAAGANRPVTSQTCSRVPSVLPRRNTTQLAKSRRAAKLVARNRMFDDDDDDSSSSGGGVGLADRERPEEGYRREYPNKLFVQETLAAFPDAGIADVEQARALYSDGGYTYLDVRPKLEVDDIGKVKGSVNVPMANSVRKYDPEQRKKVVQNLGKNEDFIKEINKKFPKKDAKLLVACSNGTKYSIDALEALDEDGYENIVGLKGGYYAWFSVFDNKLGRRRNGEYAETYTHDGDTCGIHASGAGFDRVDKADRWVPPEY